MVVAPVGLDGVEALVGVLGMRVFVGGKRVAVNGMSVLVAVAGRFVAVGGNVVNVGATVLVGCEVVVNDWVGASVSVGETIVGALVGAGTVVGRGVGVLTHALTMPNTAKQKSERMTFAREMVFNSKKPHTQSGTVYCNDVCVRVLCASSREYTTNRRESPARFIGGLYCRVKIKNFLPHPLVCRKI